MTSINSNLTTNQLNYYSEQRTIDKSKFLGDANFPAGNVMRPEDSPHLSNGSTLIDMGYVPVPADNVLDAFPGSSIDWDGIGQGTIPGGKVVLPSEAPFGTPSLDEYGDGDFSGGSVMLPANAAKSRDTE